VAISARPSGRIPGSSSQSPTGPTLAAGRAWPEWKTASATSSNAREGYHFEADEYRELDHERILALGRQSGRGKTSGLELGQMRAKGTALFQIRDGKVTKHVIYWDRDRALADLGLDPEADSA
jgi:ketosteroid isomerase-like protein